MIATIKMNKRNKMMNKMIKNTTMTRSLDSGPGGWHSLICICINICISFNICICNCIFCILNIQCIMYNVYYTWMIRTWWLAPQRNLKPCAILPCSAFLWLQDYLNHVNHILDIRLLTFIQIQWIYSIKVFPLPSLFLSALSK